MDWYNELIEDSKNDGRIDADIGTFDPPYPGSLDPKDMEKNEAYKQGFMERRKELGDEFKWR